MNTEAIFHGFLIGCMVFLALLIVVAVVRSFLGPKTADRIIAVNMIGTMVIAIIAILTILMKEDYLADVALVYAMVSFLAVVVLTKVYTGINLEKRGVRDEKKAIDENLKLAHQHAMDARAKMQEEGEEKGDDNGND